jgi:8-oxo-dGTP diphosphatase
MDASQPNEPATSGAEASQPSEPATFAVSVEVVALMIRSQQLSVLLVERREEPFRGRWALPSGFVRRGPAQPDETLDDAARRVFAEQTGIELEPVYLEQLRAYGDPGRDPRGESVSVAYLAVAPHGTGKLTARRSTVGAPHWFATSVALEGAEALALDHGRIIADAVRRTIELVETTALGLAFCHEWFTIADLRHVYENLWELPSDSLDAGNFHHRVMALKGLLEPVSEEELAAKAAWDRETERRLGIMATLPEAPAAGRGRPPRRFKRGPLVSKRGPAVSLDRPFRRPSIG